MTIWDVPWLAGLWLVAFGFGIYILYQFYATYKAYKASDARADIHRQFIWYVSSVMKTIGNAVKASDNEKAVVIEPETYKRLGEFFELTSTKPELNSIYVRKICAFASIEEANQQDIIDYINRHKNSVEGLIVAYRILIVALKKLAPDLPGYDVNIYSKETEANTLQDLLAQQVYTVTVTS